MNTTTQRPSLWKNFTCCLTKKYWDFSGTASRHEFWGFLPFFYFAILVAFSAAISVLFTISPPVVGEQNPAMAVTIFGIFLIMAVISWPPCFGVYIRRLRDAGFSTSLGYINIVLEIGLMIAFISGSMNVFIFYFCAIYKLLLIILACFPTRPALGHTPE